MTIRRTRSAIAAITATAVMAFAAAPASAFDSGPHADITQDAMSAEGFGEYATHVSQVNNWFVDLYEQASSNPFSGHAGFWKRLLGGVVASENWSNQLVEAAWRSHFDNSLTLSNTKAENEEWERLQRSVWTLVREARANNDPEQLLAVLGMSLHEVQDFYAHTNWVEPPSGNGADGPGWKERGYGSYPTWFDIPASVRETANIYSDESAGHRDHGVWDSDGNKGAFTAMNKDAPGRPYFKEAAITADFATRQWIEAVRSWVNDEAFWYRAQSWKYDQDELDRDLTARNEISTYSGHWQGQGEPLGGDSGGPGGSLPDLASATERYFRAGRTKFRGRFVALLPRMAEPHPQGVVEPIASSQGIQLASRIVVLQIPEIRAQGLGDFGPDHADMFARVQIDGQQMKSGVIFGHDAYSFPAPNAPFTWIKSVPNFPDRREPVESIEVTVKTANDTWAGTDDSVRLRLGPNLRLPLDKGLYDDFERGDSDTYSVPIDSALWNGLAVGDITEVGLEKSSDGVAGGWKLGGVRLKVNGQVAYENTHINRWLENNHRAWVAPDFQYRDPHAHDIGVVLQLDDHDLATNDDHGDINPYDHRLDKLIRYEPRRSLRGETEGGDLLGGRTGDGDDAGLAYRLETLTPELMHFGTPPTPVHPIPPPDERTPPVVTPPPPAEIPPPHEPPPGAKPELEIGSFNAVQMTIRNQGEVDAGSFRVKISNSSTTIFRNVDGIKAGSFVTIPLDLICTANYVGTVDDLNQVDEENETNNMNPSEAILC